MARPTEVEAYSIDLAFQTLEVIAEHMSDETLAELHEVRARIFGHLRDNDPANPDVILLSTALTVRQIYLGIKGKREIGEDNDTFHRSGMYFPSAEAAYEYGQKLVRWNRLLELGWLDRLLARKGPLTQIRPDDVCSYADSALTAWTERKN